nr:hypothetical protein [Tanacetum cinerariifolium]
SRVVEEGESVDIASFGATTLVMGAMTLGAVRSILDGGSAPNTWKNDKSGGCDPLALVEGFTPVEDNIGSVNLTLFSLFFEVTAINFSLVLLMLGQLVDEKFNSFSGKSFSKEIRQLILYVNEIARVANPLALVAQQQQVYHPQTHHTHYNQHSSTRTHQAATRNRGKAIVNFPQPIYDQEPSVVDDDDETSKEKEIDKLMALISLSNAGYEGQRSGIVAGARETVGSSMVQKSGIQCYNCKEYGHVARECQKPKRAKDAAYHREKMLLCKQEEVGIQLNAGKADWKDDTDDESDNQELEAHYMYMAKLQ